MSLTLVGEIYLCDLSYVHLPSLINLKLDIPIVRSIIDKILSGCPSLETLKLICLAINASAIHMPPSLKSLTFEHDSNAPGDVIDYLVIDTSSLEFLYIKTMSLCSRISVSNFTNMVQAHLDIFPYDTHVRWVPELLQALYRTELLGLEVSTIEVICLWKSHNPL